jgi:hypothetical protein
MLRRSLLALVAVATLLAAPLSAREDVDLELVLAVDISLSMDLDELRLQRQGYIDALRDPEILRAVRTGISGRIAITYVEWAGWGSVNVVVPWMILDGPESAAAITDRLAAAPTLRFRRTSISGAMRASLDLFDASPYQARRRVIDISGDGPNNEGPPVSLLREEVLRRGITINGLPVMIKRQQSGWFDVENLDEYYEDCVIGGPGSFMVPVTDQNDFARAIRTKLIMEITGLQPGATVIPASAAAPRVPCDIGEQIWRRWMDR